MRLQCVHQSPSRSVFVIYNEAEKLVGRLTKKKFMTCDDVMPLAEKFADSHPELFPGRAERHKNFDEMIKRGKNG